MYSMDDSVMYRQMFKKIDAQTLLKYGHPEIVSIVETVKPSLVIKYDQLAVGPFIPARLEAECALRSQESKEFLDFLLPPREWIDAYNRVWRQQVASSPATRFDVHHLRENLESRLVKSGAKAFGICPARRELYRQCFDELIRQAAVICGERGLCLLRIRDESLATLDGFLSVYKSAILYGMNKVLWSLYKVDQLQGELEELTKEQEELESSIGELERKAAKERAKEDDAREGTSRSHAREMEIQKRQNELLKQKLLAILQTGARRGGGF